MAIFPEDRQPLNSDGAVIGVRLKEMELHRPRQWGACWLALETWRQLGLDRFWATKLPSSREGTPWDQVLTVLVIYRLIDPGSEWRLHREWFVWPPSLIAGNQVSNVHSNCGERGEISAKSVALFCVFLGYGRQR